MQSADLDDALEQRRQLVGEVERVKEEGDSNSELSKTVVANILSLANELVEGVASFEKDSVRFNEFKLQINSAL